MIERRANAREKRVRRDRTRPWRSRSIVGEAVRGCAVMAAGREIGAALTVAALLRLGAVASLAALLFLSCPGAPRSAYLGLRLTPGMERTMKIELRERSDRPRMGPPGAPRAQPPFTLAIATTWRYRVLSVAPSGMAKVQCELLSAAASQPGAAGREVLAALARRPLCLYLDWRGRLAGVENAEPSRTDLPGRAAERGAPPTAIASALVEQTGPLFPGLPGRIVTRGESWSTGFGEPPRSDRGGGADHRGVLLWTVESITAQEVRLGFHGTIGAPPMPARTQGIASLSGDLSGFLVTERSSGWPLQGKAVLRADLRGHDPAGRAADLAGIPGRGAASPPHDLHIESVIHFGLVR